MEGTVGVCFICMERGVRSWSGGSDDGWDGMWVEKNQRIGDLRRHCGDSGGWRGFMSIIIATREERIFANVLGILLSPLSCPPPPPFSLSAPGIPFLQILNPKVRDVERSHVRRRFFCSVLSGSG